MQIFSIFTSNINNKKTSITNNRYSTTNQNFGLTLAAPISVDTVSFKGGTPNGAVLKKLLPYGIPDLYSGRPMLDPQFVQKILKRKLFSSPIRTVVKSLIPYEESLYPVERNIFSMLKSVSKNQPQKLIEDVVHELAPAHQVRLRNIQKPIFEELENLAEEMPEEQKLEFNELMILTKKKLENHPITLKFSAKEFKYQLERINLGIKSRNNILEVKTMKTLMNMAKHLPSKSDEEYAEQINKKRNGKINKTKILQNKSRREAEIIRQMAKILNESPLRKDKELNDLLMTARARIYKIPMVYSFKRKSFIHDLEKITKKLENTKLAHRLIQTALRLPTSKEDVSAFIMKAVDYSSEKIGYDMIVGSMGSIEHLTPKKRGGEDSMANYALTSVYTNNDRALAPFMQQLKMHPEIYINAQKHVDRLIELYNNGTFKKIGLSRAYIINLISKLYKMSPPENRLVIDASKLKK